MSLVPALTLSHIVMHMPHSQGDMMILMKMKSDPIRVLVVNDHQLERRGLVVLLQSFNDLMLVGVARTGTQALQLCESAQPDVVLMDLLMPDMDGAEATRMIHQRYPDIHVIVLTNWEEYEIVQRALAVGAERYQVKNMSAVQLAEAIRGVSSGEPPLSLPPADLGADLTAREMEVLDQVAQGMTNGEVAVHLIISLATVKYYVSSILGKMGASSRTEAVGLAVQHGLVTMSKDK
jgi:NarL family two-component system response regulator LiaR